MRRSKGTAREYFALLFGILQVRYDSQTAFFEIERVPDDFGKLTCPDPLV